MNINLKKKERASQILIYENGLCRLSEADGSLSSEADGLKQKVCFLSRTHYTETQKTYPIKNVLHLYRAINAELKTRSNGKVLWAVTNFELGNFEVTFWFVRQDVASFLAEKFLLVIPETFAIAKNLDEGLYQIGRTRPLFVNKYAARTTTALKDYLIPTIHRFKHLAAVPQGTVVNELDDRDYVSLLSRALSSKMVWLQPGFYIKDQSVTKRQIDWEGWKWPVIGGAAVVLAYFVGLGVYLDNQVTQTELDIAQQRKQMSAFLNLESRLKRVETLAEAHVSVSELNPGLSVFYQAIGQLSSLDPSASIRSFDVKGNQAVIQFTSNSATTTLNQLSKVLAVTSIDLTSTIVKNRENFELFEITLTFSQEVSDGTK